MMKLPVELQVGESVVLRCRRHPIYMLMRLAGIAIVALVPVAVLLAFAVMLGLDSIGGAIVVALAILWAGYCAVRAYWVWYRYEHDEWIITNQRLIDAYKRHWFDQRIASADMVNVQDMVIQKHGVLATTFNFGDVHCQTAGADSDFILSGIPDPARVLAVMDATRDAARQELAAGGSRQPVAPPDSMPGDDRQAPRSDFVPRSGPPERFT